MEHYQVKMVCKPCGKEIIADVFSVGTTHQTIHALTHKECAVYEMPEGEVESLNGN